MGTMDDVPARMRMAKLFESIWKFMIICSSWEELVPKVMGFVDDDHVYLAVL